MILLLLLLNYSAIVFNHHLKIYNFIKLICTTLNINFIINYTNYKKILKYIKFPINIKFYRHSVSRLLL